MADPHLAVHSPAVELYFATTVAPPVLPVPEPQIWLMLLAGLALLARRVNTALI
ncbi:MAG: PEP-CTERM sorting domain-containing protein [Pseudomonadota bacterium]